MLRSQLLHKPQKAKTSADEDEDDEGIIMSSKATKERKDRRQDEKRDGSLQGSSGGNRTSRIEIRGAQTWTERKAGTFSAARQQRRNSSNIPNESPFMEEAAQAVQKQAANQPAKGRASNEKSKTSERERGTEQKIPRQEVKIKVGFYTSWF